MRCSGILNFGNDDKYCLLWSILAGLTPRESSHPKRVSKYKQYFKFKIQGFDSTHSFKGRDAHKFEKLNTLSTNIVELSVYQDQNKWKIKLKPFELSKIISYKLVDLLIDENHYVLNKKLNVFQGELDGKFVCRHCLTSFSCQNNLLKHKQRYEQQEITSLKPSDESHLYWKKHFHRNTLQFRRYADFEANIEIDNSNIGNKRTNI